MGFRCMLTAAAVDDHVQVTVAQNHETDRQRTLIVGMTPTEAFHLAARLIRAATIAKEFGQPVELTDSDVGC